MPPMSGLWKIEFDPGFANDLARLSRADQIRVLAFLQNRLSGHPDPTRLAKRLQGSARPLWRYRVGDLRIIAEIQESKLLIVAIMVAHRSKVYR
jgi:mRNA interferase RelE/StbE